MLKTLALAKTRGLLSRRLLRTHRARFREDGRAGAQHRRQEAKAPTKNDAGSMDRPKLHWRGGEQSSWQLWLEPGPSGEWPVHGRWACKRAVK